MKLTPSHRACFFAAALGLAPAMGFAQPVVDPVAAARAAFERGLAEARADRFAAAASAFEESYRLRSAPVVLYNLAGAYARMGNDRRAIETYERYLTEGGTALPDDRVRLVRESIERLRRELATVPMRVDPPDAVVEVDGRVERLQGGALVLDPGMHVCTLSAPGRVSVRRDLRLSSGANSPLEVRLDALPPQATPSPVVVRVETPRPVVTPHPAPVQAPAAASRGITSQWWFWTGIGVVLAGATVGALAAGGVFTSEEPLVGGTAFNVSAVQGR